MSIELFASEEVAEQLEIAAPEMICRQWPRQHRPGKQVAKHDVVIFSPAKQSQPKSASDINTGLVGMFPESITNFALPHAVSARFESQLSVRCCHGVGQNREGAKQRQY